MATVAIATGAAWMAATRSLRQVQAMADLADDWREHDVGRRFDPGEGGDEIAHLGRTLDQMLDRIVDSLSAERRLTDEIAHELRTPLAVVLAEADLARQHATTGPAGRPRQHPRRRRADARLHRHHAVRGSGALLGRRSGRRSAS